MGSALCTLFRQRPVRILFYGLDAVGKTTLLYRLKLGEVVTTIPTIGFNVEEVDVNGMKTVMWDVGLREKSRPLIRHYLDTTDAIVFMIDSTDRERLREAVEEFFHIISEAVQEQQLPVLVLANKQDKTQVLSPEEIKKAIYERGRESFRVNTALEVFPTVAPTLEGVSPALDWLTSQLALRMARLGHASPFFPSALWAKATHYPASFVKSAYHRVVGLVSVSKGGEEEEEEEEEGEEEKLGSESVEVGGK